jgi:hypothetical protein
VEQQVNVLQGRAGRQQQALGVQQAPGALQLEDL